MKTITAALFFLILAVSFILPVSVYAEKTDKTIRVGWYESLFNMTDKFGRRSGFSYEYQRKIAAYTGWSYQYVEGNWPDLLKMLEEGRIDLLGDISYTEERAEHILYTSIPMGTESYYIFITPDNTEINGDDYASLNGKKVGVTERSIQKDMFSDWASSHNITAEVIELSGSDQENLKVLQRGEIDAFVTLDAYADPDTTVPVWKIGASDFYFAVSKSRPDVLQELDAALNRIQEENSYYSHQLYDKYLRSINTSRYLTSDEKAWLSEHGPIRVGYQDNYLAFCASDPETGELTGALKDYLAYASTGMENVEMEFVTTAYPTASAALEALKAGEVDCMFPANLTDYDGEEMGVVITPAIMRTEMDAVVRSTEQQSFIRRKQARVGVNLGNPNYDMFLMDYFPDWQAVKYTDTPACLEAVKAGEADCIIISNYRFNNISKLCKKLHLTTVYTGVDLDYSFAVREGDTKLYSILARINGMVPAATINAALTYYSSEDARTSFMDLVMDNLTTFVAIIAIITIVILSLLLWSIRAEKKALEEKNLVQDLNKRVFVDALTSVRNKGAYSDMIAKLQKQLDQNEPLTFAITVFDCDNLKQINDRYGHDKGDEYLKNSCHLICRIFNHSPVFRIGGDEFAVLLQNADYENWETLVNQFETERESICRQAEKPWEEVHVSLGIAVFDPEQDGAIIDTARRADKMMYVNKRQRKENNRT